MADERTNTFKMIRKYGKAVTWTARGGVDRAIVKCQGCGKDIYSDDCADVDYAISTRGSANFWHHDCFKDVWTHGIV